MQFHFLVRPSFATCAVPALIFELSVPILPHVQFQQNMHYPILPHVQLQQEYELATLGSCMVKTPFHKQQFHKKLLEQELFIIPKGSYQDLSTEGSKKFLSSLELVF